MATQLDQNRTGPATKLDSPLNVASIRQEIIENFEAGGRFQVTESHNDKAADTPRDDDTKEEEEEAGPRAPYIRRRLLMTSLPPPPDLDPRAWREVVRTTGCTHLCFILNF